MTDVEPSPLNISGPRLSAYAGLAAVAGVVWVVAGPPELTWWGAIAALIVVEPAVHRTIAGRRRLAANRGALIDRKTSSARGEFVSVSVLTVLLVAVFLGLSALLGNDHGAWDAIAVVFVILVARDVSRLILRHEAARTAGSATAFGR